MTIVQQSFTPPHLMTQRPLVRLQKPDSILSTILLDTPQGQTITHTLHSIAQLKLSNLVTENHRNYTINKIIRLKQTLNAETI